MDFLKFENELGLVAFANVAGTVLSSLDFVSDWVAPAIAAASGVVLYLYRNKIRMTIDIRITTIGKDQEVK